MSSILSQLNPQQQDAVTHGSGPLLIFAGAGTGKTRVLTNRIAYLLRERGVRPYNVLAVTFTNKAANEMRQRIEGLVGGLTRGMWVGTFHAMCARLLRAQGDRVGIDPRFVVFDTGDQQTLIKQSLEELNLDTKRFRPQDILSLISSAKNELMLPRQFALTADGYVEQVASRVYELYQRKLRVNRACDFDDLLLYSAQLLEECPDVAEQYQDRFQQVLVDEYQDINFAQYKLMENLARKHRNICVVGDDDQSIYRWRGADVRWILQFEKDYPDAKVVKLEQNYRSTQTILDAAYGVIRKNPRRKDKRLWTTQSGGYPIIVQDTANEIEEAHFIVTKAQELVSEPSNSNSEGAGRRLSDFAVLYRVNAQSRVIEEEFVKFGVPYRLVGAVQFYQRREIKDIVAYLKVLYNPYDTVSLRRIINVPTRGIGQRTLELLEQEATQRESPLMEVLQLVADRFEGIAQGSAKRGTKGKTPDTESPSPGPPLPSQLLAPRVGGGLHSFVNLLRRTMEEFERHGSITQLTQSVLEHTGYHQNLEEERSLEAAERLENIKEFLSATQEFEERVRSGENGFNDLAELDEGSESYGAADADPDGLSPGPGHWSLATDHSLLLGRFLEGIALVSDVDKLREEANAVTLMTLHAAKGLEFPIVFMVGMEDNVFPHSRAMFDTTELEEERRLCYVGLTRAKEQVYLTHAHRRTLYGMTVDSMLSQFVRDIPENLLCRQSGQSSFGSTWWAPPSSNTKSSVVSHQLSASRDQSPPPRPPSVDWRVGDKVRHGKWGEGIVVKTPNNGEPQDWVEVAFPSKDIGIKKLMLGYAPLEKVT